MIEMVMLAPEAEPEWREAEAYIDSLILEEIDDELVELCGVDVDTDLKETWLEQIKKRLRLDLERFRDDLETDRDQIEQWELEGMRIYTSAGQWEDESDPHSGHGWMCRLVDSGALGAAGFKRIRRPEL